MNKVFKIVWSKSKQCYVVVSEYAKSNGGKKKVLATVLAGLMMAGVAGGLAPQQALAGDDYGNSAINIEPNNLPLAYRNKGVNKNAIAIGGQNNVTGTAGNGRIALGFGNTASKDSSVAIGSSNDAVGGGSTAIGVDAHAGEAVQNINGSNVTVGGSVALGNSVWAMNAAAVAIGTHVNASGTAAGAYSTAMGSKTDATGLESVAIGTLDKATGTQSVAVGAESEATATNATAIGSKNTATQQAATALGTWTNATGLRSTAVGVNAAASGQSSQAMGDHAEATGFGATAVGKAAKAKAQSAGAFGDTANATGVQSLAAGYSTTATNEDSNAIGSRTSSTGKYATAVGTEANASGESGFAAGAKINATGNQSTAVGYNSTASGAGSVTLGRDATASATGAYAMGYGANATNTSAFAIGSKANAGAYGSMAIGKGATTKAQDATSTYSYSGTGGAVGASGYNTETSTIHSGAGTDTASDTYNAGDTLAIGTNATVSEQSNETVAIGKGSLAEKNTHYSTVIGQGAQAREGASDSTVIGHGASSAARESVVIGRTANVTGTNSVRSTAMGWGAQVSNAYDAVALGAGSQTSVNGGVALGAGAVASRDTSDLKSLPYDAAYANGGAIHTRKYNSPARTSGATQSAVSVGNDNDKRQIINVAGGSDDYDAVNVAQLKNVGVIVKGNTGKSDFLVHDGSLKVEGTGRISTVAADDGTKDSKITLSFDDSGLANTSLTNITNDGKKTITGLGTIVKAGDNVTVTSTSDATTGQKTYTVSTTSPVVYTDKDGNKVYLHDDGKFYTSATGGTEVNNSNVIASFKDPSGATTGGTMIVNNVGSAISNHTTPGVTSPTYLDKLDAAAGDTKTQNAAVNVTDLKNTADGLTEKGLKFDANSGGVKTNKLGSTVKVQGEGAKADTEYSGKNVKTFINQDSVGNTTIDVKLDKNLETDTITATGKDGKDGKIGINGHDGVTTTITVTRDGKPGLDGAPGTTTTRVVYEKPDGSKEEVATLNDGLRFTGNNTSTENKHKLNSLVKVKGEGVTEAEANAFDSAAGNIAVVADGTDTLTIKLNKNVKGLNTVETKTIQLGDPAGNHTTINYAGDRITYTTPDTTPGATPGSTVTHKVANLEDELHIKPGTYTPNAAGKVTLTYVDGNGNDVAGKTAVVDLSSFTPASGMGKWVAKSSAGEGTHSGDTTQDITDSKAVEFQAGKNVTITQTNDGAGNTVIKYGLSDEIEVGKEGAPGAPGKDGKVGVKGADGSAVVINGKDGSIGLNGTNGRDGITIQGKDGAKGLDGTNTTRIVYHDETNNKDHEVATLDDGMKYAGDDAQGTDKTKVVKKKLNETLDIIGGADATKLTDGNIGVNNDGNGKLKVQLSKNLKDINTIKNGGTTITLNTTPGGASNTPAVVISGGNLSMDGNKITNVAPGEISSTSTEAVNGSQLYKLKAEERHIRPTNVPTGSTETTQTTGTDAVYKYDATTKKVTLVYNDGNGTAVNDTKAVIDFSDLATGGSGTNTTVESTDGTVKVTDNGTSPDHKYDLAVNSQKVVNNAQLPVTYTKADGTKVYLHNDGNFYDDKAEGQGNLVAKSDVIASMNDGNNSTTAPMRLNNVASSISNQTGATFLDKLDAANTNNPNSAVNVSDLKNTADGLTDKGLKFDANSGGVKTNKLGSTVKVQGAGTKADTNYDGSNIKTFIDQDASGNTTIDVKLDKDLKTETITAAGKDGKDGKIGINGHDGVTTTITVTRDGKPGLDGAPGTTTTRVVYEKPDGSKEEVATLNDGLRFTGNNTSTENKHKLNSLVKVKGEGVTEAEANAFDSAAGNIAVVADGTDTLTIKLNKNVKGLNTVETKTIQLGDPAGNHTTINYAGDRITYTTPDTTPGATPGSTVTHKVANLEDELHIKPGTYTPNAAGKVTLTYVDGNGNDVAGKTAVVDLSSFTPASGMGKWVAKSSAGEGTHSGDTTQDITDSKAVEFQAGKNVTITQTNDGAGNTVIKYGLSDEIEVGKEGAPGAPGKDGKVGVKGADGSAVVINGKDGSIGLNGTNGRDGITIQGKDGAKGLDGTNTTRIVYHDETNNKDHEVATLDDGMKFAGDDGQTDSSKVISKKLNTVVDIVGGADKTKLTDNNIGVNNVNGKLKVQLSKDLDLTAGGSVKMGDTTVNNGGITIKAPTGGTTTDVHLGSDGLNNGGNKITNVAKGTADTDAVNVSQLKDAKSELKADERHIKPGTYTVDSNGKVTMTYVDGNGHDVANEKAVIEGIAKNDLSNITNDGKNVITNLIDMENGNNTTVSSRKDATGKKIFKVDVDLSATNRKVDTAATGTGSVASGSAAGAAVVNKGTQFVAGDNMVVKRETMSGNDTDQKITYALNPNLQNIKSISSGTTTSNAPRIDFGSNTVTINNGNLSLGGNKITNLAPGTSSTDAVNLSQLEGARTKVTSNDGSVTVTRNENTTTKEITYDLHVAGGNGTPDPTIYNRINKLGDEIETVGALGAALGALKPIQYDPLEPTQIMAGYGNYRGTSALALGVAHYRNESLMMHAGMSWAGGSSHMMANAGVTWKLGHRDPETAIADRYRRGPISSAYALQQEMAAVKEENQGLKGEVADLKSENAEMKKNIAMLMAKLGM
mgnify:FL=1